MCEGSSCVTGERCMGHQCFSSLALNGDALVSQKGCFKVLEQSTMTCKTPPSRDQIVECCHGHLCNLNITVALPVQGSARRRRCRRRPFWIGAGSFQPPPPTPRRLDACSHKRSRCAIQKINTDAPFFSLGRGSHRAVISSSRGKVEGTDGKKNTCLEPRQVLLCCDQDAQQGGLCPG